MLSNLLNWLRWKLFFVFMFFYSNIYIYSEKKKHKSKLWFNYAKKSFWLLNSNYILLIFYIISLFIFGKISKILILFKNFIKIFFTFKHLFVYWCFYFWQLKNFYYFINNSIINHNIDYDDFTYNFNVFNNKNFIFYYSSCYNLFFNLKIFNILYTHSKNILVVCVLTFFLLNYLIIFFHIVFLKQIAIWLVIGSLVFWLFSGFNFFLKRYFYGNFTSAIKRFWKRANMCFWLVEGFLFSLFYYYYLNSSQEPSYIYDYSTLNQEYLLDLLSAYDSLFILSSIFFFLSIFLLKLNHTDYFQSIFFVVILSILIWKIFFIESYQFYYVITIFSEYFWSFDDDFFEWKSVLETPKFRSKTYYFLLCLIAKYWHFIFIFFSWIFFIIKLSEINMTSYELVSYNLQNFIILFVLNLLTYSQWIKWLWRRYADLTYFWFFLNYDLKQNIYIFKEYFSFLKILIKNKVWTIKNFNFSTTIFSTQHFLLGDFFVLNNLKILY